MNWCAEQAKYALVLPPANPGKTKKTCEALGKAKVKQDALLLKQLTVWFDAVRQIRDPVVAACLQTLLPTGKPTGEAPAPRWEEINTKWRGLTIREKVEEVA